MITIILNGETRQVETALTIDKLLHLLDLSEKRLAIEVNLNLVSRTEFTHFTLKQNDKVEIVQAIGGG